MQNNKNNGQTRSWNNQNSENVKKGARLKVIAWVIFVIILLFGELLGFGLAAAIRNNGGFAFYLMEYCHDKPICFKSINLLINYRITFSNSPLNVVC